MEQLLLCHVRPCQVKPCHFDLHLYYRFKARRAVPRMARLQVQRLQMGFVITRGLMEASSSNSRIHFITSLWISIGYQQPAHGGMMLHFTAPGTEKKDPDRKVQEKKSSGSEPEARPRRHHSCSVCAAVFIQKS